MARNNKLLEEAQRLVKESEPNDIVYVGPKPWYERALSKFKFGLMAGLATGLVSGLSAFGVIDTSVTKDFNMDVLKDKASRFLSVEDKQVETKEILAQGTIQKIKEVEPEKRNFEDSLAIFKKEHPNIDFTNINNPRDVSKQFLGENNFIALAAEMEGFRGDLHKDPATGLNIGFGYNITKRVQASQGEVVKDLLSIGIDNDKVREIIEISKAPQSKISKEIKKFNTENKLENNQLISIEQGVALLKRTQKEYENQARASFPNAFDKMAKNQKEVLTYAAYKAGFEALSKYKKASKAAEHVYSKNKQPGISELKTIAKELSFYYKKDGKEMVLDERASLIAHTFVSSDYLGVQIGKTNNLKQTPAKLAAQKIDFSHLKVSLNDDEKPHVKSKLHEKPDLSEFLNKLRDKDNKNNHKHKMG